MLPSLDRIKGIHPGAVLKREIQKRKLKSIEFASEINEYPQTINAITKERRGINAKLSYKLGEYFEIPHDYFILIQAAFEVEAYRKSKLEMSNPLIGKFRNSLFWDTRIESIDYQKNKRSVIQRTLERGNKTEIKNLIQLYSLDTINKELDSIKNSFIPNFQVNIQKYIKSSN